jgi:hypothetical protein
MEQNETDCSDDTAGLTNIQLPALPYPAASPALADGARPVLSPSAYDVAGPTVQAWDDGLPEGGGVYPLPRTGRVTA